MKAAAEPLIRMYPHVEGLDRIGMRALQGVRVGSGGVGMVGRSRALRGFMETGSPTPSPTQGMPVFLQGRLLMTMVLACETIRSSLLTSLGTSDGVRGSTSVAFVEGRFEHRLLSGKLAA